MSMDKKIKNYLGITIIVVLAVVALSGAVYVYFYSKASQPTSYRSFSVSGDGKVVLVPDLAQFSFSVITEGSMDVANLQKINTEKMNKVIEFVKSKQIDAKDIKTQSYSLYPRYQYYDCNKVTGVCPPAEIVGYTVSQSVSVKIRDFAKIGDLLSGVVTGGANSVSELSFTVDDLEAAQNEARAEAIDKAKDKAKAIAKAGGFRLGKLISIEEGGGAYPTYMELAYGMGGGAEAAPAPKIEPGSQEVSVSVTLMYEIK